MKTNERRREGENGEKGAISGRKAVVRKHTDLEVYGRAFAVAMELFALSKNFPTEERYSLTDQMRRSSRSVCANLAEAWRKRRYPASFVAKLGDSEGEAAEAQTWIQFAVACGYLDANEARKLYSEYDDIIGMLITIITHPDRWTLSRK